MSSQHLKESILEARGIEKAYKGPNGEAVAILNGIDLAIEAGESISITGESGSGKTTLLNTLSLLEKPDVGSIFWNGNAVEKDNNSAQAKQRSEFMGFIFQQFYLIPELDVLSNVLMPKRILGNLSPADRDRARALLAELGLGDRIHYNTQKLSGGEMQRVAIARALINQPKLILADEPTGSIDERHGESIMQILLKLCKTEGCSILLVTHNQTFASWTDRQLRLNKGILQVC